MQTGSSKVDQRQHDQQWGTPTLGGKGFEGDGVAVGGLSHH